mgnify:CR=1 FL=1
MWTLASVEGENLLLNDVFALRRKKQMKWNDDQKGEASMFHNEAETELMRSVKNYNLI